MDKTIEIWCDGACRGNGTNHSVGGYGVVLKFGAATKTLNGAQYDTTNNAQEIRAAIVGLQAITNKYYNVVVYTDSAYVVNCIENKWYKKWMINGWKTSKGTPVLNVPLWNELIKECASFLNVKFVHVKGHQGIGENETADMLANIAIDELELSRA
jgi:ribonuclease HI